MTAMLAGLAPATQADEAASAGAWRDPVDQPSELMPQAAHALLLGLTEVGNAAVAVGAHGIVLRSTDRSHWEQVADVPTRSTLTAVTAVGNKLWAVGHDGVILASADAGQHWTLQRKDPWHAPPGDAATSDPRQGTPLLDVLFLDESNGFAVGAYSQLLVTHDGGTTWAAQRVARPAAGASEAGPPSRASSSPSARKPIRISTPSPAPATARCSSPANAAWPSARATRAPPGST